VAGLVALRRRVAVCGYFLAAALAAAIAARCARKLPAVGSAGGAGFTARAAFAFATGAAGVVSMRRLCHSRRWWSSPNPAG